MEQIIIKIKGTSPLLMHSDRYSNPLDPLTKTHKELTSKRKKTDEDHEAIAYSEWRGALYYDDKMGPYIPAMNIESMLQAAAKMQKLGSKFKQAVMVIEDKIKLEYSGPRELRTMYAAGYADFRSVKVQQARLQRCRPKFDEWTCSFTLAFNPAILNKSDIQKAVCDAGALVGLGDFRPRFGRFEMI